MRVGYWVGIGLAGILVLGILDDQNNFQNTAASPITREMAISDVHKAFAQNGEVPANLETIHFHLEDGLGFAFVKYQYNNHPELAAIIASKNGYEMASGSFLPDKNEPIPSFGVSGDGWQFIAGLVNNHPEVKSAVIIFSDGTAESVPVQNGYFWYAHQAPSSFSNVHFLKVIGITNTGGILMNSSNAGPHDLIG